MKTFRSNRFLSLFALGLILTATSCQKKEGCNDPMAVNFDAEAEKDNGTCEYVHGCTDSKAINFASDAVKDDGTCRYAADQFIGTWNVKDSIRDVFIEPMFHHRQYKIQIERSMNDPDSIKITNFANLGDHIWVMAKVENNTFILDHVDGRAPAGHVHDRFFKYVDCSSEVTVDDMVFDFIYAEIKGDLRRGKGTATRTL
ncbi:hypothetical protein KFE98_20885 [bacterium SCSIO 12741]|nr:hypothetical protein KFE98_20885 [bacterium SCSIO 12741]